MTNFNEELYLEMMQEENENYDNDEVVDAYNKAFKEIWE